MQIERDCINNVNCDEENELALYNNSNWFLDRALVILNL